MDNIWDYILFPLDFLIGWRFWAAFVPTLMLALLFQFVVGWNPVTIAITGATAVISLVVGILWEATND